MVNEALIALAAAGGSAVVQAAGTDAWNGFRQAVARMFGRGDEQRVRAALEHLDGTATAVEGAGSGDEMMRLQQAMWQGRFEGLLQGLEGAERDTVAAGLRALVDQYAPGGQEGAAKLAGNTFHGPTAVQLGDGNHQVNRFGSGV